MKKTVNKASRGCVTTIAIFVVAIIIFSIQQSFIQLRAFPSFVVAYILSSILVNKITYASNQKAARASITRYLVLGFLVIAAFLYVKNKIENNTHLISEEKEESTTSEVIKENNTTVKVISHYRKWRDNYGNRYQGKLAIRELDYKLLKGNIKSFRAQYASTFWHDLYAFMYNRNKNKLDLMYDTFKTIRKQRKLNQRDFAEMVVTCIQDIPYSLVLQSTCELKNLKQKVLKDVLRKCSTCCIGNVKYGVQHPTAFIGNLKGDCDTRTVLIFTILKHFGYDVAILNSNYYRHSVLGLNIPANGLYKAYKGKKYYLWETTSKYFKLGYLAKNVNNVKHWDMIITSK